MKKLACKLAALALVPALATSCMTTYDAQGNPVQSVDPAAAAAGVAAAAAISYAVGRNSKRGESYYYGGGYYRPPYGYYPRPRPCRY
ncbi:MAG: hypothetical protein AAGI48_02600 [Verrucomicrobiota bacterium]